MAKVKEVNVIKCIHGIYWTTCSLCYQKGEEEVLRELNLLKEEQSNKLKFDYQDSQESDEQEFDNDYDLEDMRMS